MKPRYKDITGNTYGRLTVIRYDHTDKRGQARWYCQCSCGESKVVTTKELNYGSVKSCGCLNKESIAEIGKKRKKTWEPIPCIIKDTSCYKIPLTKNKFAIIDIQDYDLIKDHTWRYLKTGYAAAHLGDKSEITLHRMLLGLNENEVIKVDHKNRNRLDNRRCNLRKCNDFQNSWNSGLRSNNTSGVKGVSFYKRINKWVAYITVHKKYIHLGHFDNIEDAARIRKEAEVRYLGDFTHG